MKKFFASMTVFLALLTLLALPHIIAAQTSVPSNATLIVCGTENASDHACGWTDLVNLAQHIINFCIYIAIPLAALSIAVAGVKILTAGGNSGQVGEAKKMMGKIAWGLFWVIAAWLVIHTLLAALLGNNAGGYSLLK